MSGASVCLSAPWLFHSLCHSSCLGCSKPWLNVGYFGGFLHKSEVGDKWVSWAFHWSHHSTFVDWFPSFRFSCEKDKAFSCELCMNPLLHVMHVLYSPSVGSACCLSLTCRYQRWTSQSMAETSFHSFVSLHQGLYLKGILRPSQAVIL